MGGLIDVIESNILPIVGKAAPLLASVLGTPLAGVAVSLIANAFNVSSKDTVAIASALSSDPEASLKLKNLEYENTETLAKIASSNYALEVQDREDARKNAIIFKDFLRHMAYLITVGFFAALALLFLPIAFNTTERELLSMLVGMLVSKWQTIIDFFYGSSQAHGGVK